MLHQIRHVIESRFGLVLLSGALMGLALPGIDRLPNASAVLVLALLMFISCYRLRDGGFASVRVGQLLGFWVVRYSVLPAGMWLVAKGIAPDYAVGVFLLAVLPAGVSSPAIAHIYGGVVAPG
ncbi:MAG: hypothetical protein K2Q01_06085, partial [Rickettsiales bacterium]|nr:hypothetical protein [Rickettsiales bacterium]